MALLPSDDELPTWLHTFACYFVVSLFGVPLIWMGVQAIRSRHLDPVSGPEFGEYFFGNAPLDGNAAVWAGWSLIALGASFLALGARYTRAGQERTWVRMLPWIFLAASIWLGWLVGHRGH